MALRRSLPSLRPITNALSSSSALGPGRQAQACVRRGRPSSVPSLGLAGGAAGTRGGVGGSGAPGDRRVLLPGRGALRGAGVRRFGVVDTVQDKIISRNAAKQDNEYKQKMEELSMMETFNLEDFVKIIEAPLGKFSAKLPWYKNKDELVMMKLQKKVLDGLTPLQRKQPELIRHGHKQTIAARAGVTAEDVDVTLASYREVKAMHAWLSTRRKRKEKIPRTQEEMQVMASDRTGTMLMKFMKVKRTSSGKPSCGF